MAHATKLHCRGLYSTKRRLVWVPYLVASLPCLQAEHAHLRASVASSDTPPATLLSEADQQALLDLEDQLDNLQAELEYVDKQKAGVGQSLSESDAISQEFRMQCKNLNGIQARVLLQQTLEALVKNGGAQSASTARSKKLEAALSETNRYSGRQHCVTYEQPGAMPIQE